MGLLDWADQNWGLLDRLMRANERLYRVSRGYVGHKVPFAPPMLILHHVGARSGRKRSSVLAYVRDGDDHVVIASKGGYPKNPAWFHNLKANPETTIQVGRRTLRVRARVANPHERERLWPKAVETYRPYATYQERTDREIPMVILEPR